LNDSIEGDEYGYYFIYVIGDHIVDI